MGGRRGRHWSRDLLCWRSRIASARRRCQRHGARRVHADSCGRSACAARGNKQNGHVTVSSSKLRALEHSTKKGTFLMRSEEHTSELQSRLHLVCRLLLETKKPTNHRGDQYNARTGILRPRDRSWFLRLSPFVR